MTTVTNVEILDEMVEIAKSYKLLTSKFGGEVKKRTNLAIKFAKLMGPYRNTDRISYGDNAIKYFPMSKVLDAMRFHLKHNKTKSESAKRYIDLVNFGSKPKKNIVFGDNVRNVFETAGNGIRLNAKARKSYVATKGPFQFTDEKNFMEFKETVNLHSAKLQPEFANEINIINSYKNLKEKYIGKPVRKSRPSRKLKVKPLKPRKTIIVASKPVSRKPEEEQEEEQQDIDDIVSVLEEEEKEKEETDVDEDDDEGDSFRGPVYEGLEDPDVEQEEEGDEQ